VWCLHFPRFLLSSSSPSCGLLEHRTTPASTAAAHTAIPQLIILRIIGIAGWSRGISATAAPLPCKDEIIQHRSLSLCFRSESFGRSPPICSILCDKDDVIVVCDVIVVLHRVPSPKAVDAPDTAVDLRFTRRAAQIATPGRNRHRLVCLCCRIRHSC
jgi:hypothetical protein